MEVGHLTVEVRNRDLERLGVIQGVNLDLVVEDEFNNVGSWVLRLPAEHPLTGPLRMPGSGLIVSGPNGVLMSGPTVLPADSVTSSDPAGLLTVTGVTDTVALADTLAWPQPTNVNPEAQTVSHDERTGNAESLMHQYVNANMGPGAPALRRKAKLTMGVNLGRGPVLKKKARFPILGNLLSEIAVLGELGFRVIQRDGVLVFETYEVTDRSRLVRFDVHNGNIASQQYAIAPPLATQIIVAGQGDLVQRQFHLGNTPDSLQAEIDWGRRIESFVDQRQTDDPDEHKQKADELLAESGFTQTSVKVVPSDDMAMQFGRDWNVGDRISVTVNGNETVATVSGYKLVANKAGLRLGATVGDIANLDKSIEARRRLETTAQRVDALERAGSGGGGGGSSDAGVFNFMGAW